MTALGLPGGSYLVTNARVARRRLLVIPVGDGVPATHTALTGPPDRKVTSTTPGRAPHSFAASLPGNRPTPMARSTSVTVIDGTQRHGMTVMTWPRHPHASSPWMGVVR